MVFFATEATVDGVDGVGDMMDEMMDELKKAVEEGGRRPQG
jgi:hypothetical protein